MHAFISIFLIINIFYISKALSSPLKASDIFDNCVKKICDENTGHISRCIKRCESLNEHDHFNSTKEQNYNYGNVVSPTGSFDNASLTRRRKTHKTSREKRDTNQLTTTIETPSTTWNNTNLTLITWCYEYKMNNTPVELMFEEYRTVLLECDFCANKSEKRYITAEKVRWSVVFAIDGNIEVPESGYKLKYVQFDGKHVVLMPDGALLFRDIQMNRAGEYQCWYDGEKESRYLVHIAQEEHFYRVYENPSAGQKSPELNRTLGRDSNLKVFTHWEAWTNCSRCHVDGEKRKLGYCTVIKVNNSLPSHPIDIKNLAFYEDGIPCRSTALPKRYKELPLVKNRKSEVIVERCRVACPTIQPYTNITDKWGNLLSFIETGGGGFREYPVARATKAPPKPSRQSIYALVGHRLTLECPLKDVDRLPISWKNRSTQIVYYSTLVDQLPRVYIDILNRLMIERTKYEDTSVYSCFYKEKLVTSITVKVVDSFSTGEWENMISGLAGWASIALLAAMGLGIYRAQRSNTGL